MREYLYYKEYRTNHGCSVKRLDRVALDGTHLSREIILSAEETENENTGIERSTPRHVERTAPFQFG